jgi:hypothetical protein
MGVAAVFIICGPETRWSAPRLLDDQRVGARRLHLRWIKSPLPADFLNGASVQTEVIRDKLRKDITYQSGEPEPPLVTAFAMRVQGGKVDDFVLIDASPRLKWRTVGATICGSLECESGFACLRPARGFADYTWPTFIRPPGTFRRAIWLE